jgi:hypothetical protein
MLAALFWFWKGNDITDEPALDALKDNNHFEATDIWEKLIVTGIVTERNASAFNNISTFNLLAASCNKTLAINFIKDAIEKKIKFLDSDFYRKLVTSVTDSTYKTTGKKLQLLFLKKIVEQIERNQLPQIIRHINTFDFAAKAEFLKSVSQQFSANITTQVETARRTRTTDKQHAAVAGNNLNKNTKDDLAQLKEIFGTTDFSYSNTADKVANEILQCGIDFFNHYKDNSLDPGDLTMSVF